MTVQPKLVSPGQFMAGLELVTCKQTDTSQLQGPLIITGLSNQMIWWLLKSFFFSRVDIFFGYILLSCDARGWLLIAVCVLFHSQLHPVISVSQKLHCDVFVFRALKLLCSAQVKSRTLPQSVKYFWKGQGCKD